MHMQQEERLLFWDATEECWGTGEREGRESSLGEKEKSGTFRITGGWCQKEWRPWCKYASNMVQKNPEALKSSSYHFFLFSQTSSPAFSDLLMVEHPWMCTEITSQPVYLLTQLIVHYIRFKIDKDFCPTEGYIPAEKDRWFIQMQWNWKQCFISGFRARLEENREPKRIRTAVRGPIKQVGCEQWYKSG